MDLNVIPAIAFAAFLFFSSSSQATIDPAMDGLKSSGYVIDEAGLAQNPDYNSILTYIKTKYHKVSDEDAGQIAKYVVQFGKEHDVDPKLAAALMARESGFNKEAVSSTGAKGLGQIKNFNFKTLQIEDPFDIKQNVYGTTKYMKYLLGSWQTRSEKVSLALASYFRGINAVKRQNGDMDPKTQGYVQDILKHYDDISVLQKQYEARAPKADSTE